MDMMLESLGISGKNRRLVLEGEVCKQATVKIIKVMSESGGSHDKQQLSISLSNVSPN